VAALEQAKFLGDRRRRPRSGAVEGERADRDDAGFRAQREHLGEELGEVGCMMGGRAILG
jgi:hypothetical protein